MVGIILNMLNEYKRKTFQGYIESLKLTNIQPSYYYTDYQKIVKYTKDFEVVINKLGLVENSKDFIDKMKLIYQEDNDTINIIPLFCAVRPDKLVVLKDGKYVEKFASESVSFDEAMEFLKEVGFFELLDDINNFDIKSYFYGVNVGLDSNARKNRGGKQMEELVNSYLVAVENINYIKQCNFDRINENFGTSFSSPKKKKKKFDFAIFSNDVLYLIETNFFNTSGSKTDVNTRFQNLKEDLEDMDETICFILITDGNGIKKASKEIEDIYDELNVFNISDLENGLFKTIFK